MRIVDEHNVPWIVRGGDPAARLIGRLKRAACGLDFIVLPRVTLATGDLPFGVPDELPGDLIRRMRLLDCLAVLEE